MFVLIETRQDDNKALTVAYRGSFRSRAQACNEMARLYDKETEDNLLSVAYGRPTGNMGDGFAQVTYPTFPEWLTCWMVMSKQEHMFEVDLV